MIRATPKNLISGLITLILVVGEWRYGVLGGYPKLAMTLGACVGTEVLLSWLLLRKWPQLQSAYITGISLSILLRPMAGEVWPFLVGGALSIAAKYVLRAYGRHLFNPSNFGLSVLVLLAPAKVALLSHELGNDLLGNAVIWFVGLLVVWRAKVVHITLAYAASFSILAAARSVVVGTPLSAELAPLTGPMYQLLVFFMLTDPRTVVGTRRGQIVTVVAIAALEAVMRLANDFEFTGAEIFAPAPPILALFFVGPVFLLLDLRRRARGAPER
jgi:Na+-translocating ferredoxin:NAD+ oxidoreductase RnfD subunit